MGGGTPVALTAAASSTAWTLIADAKLQSVGLNDSTSSFGLGARYHTFNSELSLLVRKGVADSVVSRPRDHAFGAFVLSPETAKLGLSFRWDAFWNSGWKCVSTKPDTPRGKACEDPDHSIEHTARWGGFVSVNAGQVSISTNTSSLPGTDMIEGATLVSAAITLGLSFRYEDDFVLQGIHRPFVLGLWLGPTSRIVGGDLSQDQRKQLFGSSALSFWGVEAGGLVRLGTADLIAKLSWIGLDKSDSVAGLERLQIVPSVQFSLPLDILTPTSQSASP